MRKTKINKTKKSLLRWKGPYWKLIWEEATHSLTCLGCKNSSDRNVPRVYYYTRSATGQTDLGRELRRRCVLRAGVSKSEHLKSVQCTANGDIFSSTCVDYTSLFFGLNRTVLQWISKRKRDCPVVIHMGYKWVCGQRGIFCDVSLSLFCLRLNPFPFFPPPPLISLGTDGAQHEGRAVSR